MVSYTPTRPSQNILTWSKTLYVYPNPYEDDINYEDNLKYGENIKYKDNFKYEDNL